jgi:hypothetical protein
MKYLLATALILFPLTTAAAQNGQSQPLPERIRRIFPPLEFDKPFAGKYSEIPVGPALIGALCPKNIVSCHARLRRS